MKKLTPKQRLALVRTAQREAKLTSGFDPKGGHWKKVMASLQKLENDCIAPPMPNVPALGPVIKGGRDVLLESCTHNTDGIAHYPAFDSGFNNTGLAVLAPESLTITDATSGAMGGDAFYAKGASGILYWFGHVTHVPPQGAKFRKGAQLSTIAGREAGHHTPHVHLGIDARSLLSNRELLYGRDGHGPDYTFGAPSIGAQLKKGRS